MHSATRIHHLSHKGRQQAYLLVLLLALVWGQALGFFHRGAHTNWDETKENASFVFQNVSYNAHPVNDSISSTSSSAAALAQFLWGDVGGADTSEQLSHHCSLWEAGCLLDAISFVIDECAKHQSIRELIRVKLAHHYDALFRAPFQSRAPPIFLS